MSTATLDPRTFDVLAFVSNSAYPTEVVTVYTDAATAHELGKVVKARKEAEKQAAKNPDADAQPNTDVTDEETALRAKLQETALTFTLQGKSPKALEELLEGIIPDNFESLSDQEKAEVNQKQSATLLANCILKAETADGSTDTTWTVDKVTALFGFLNASESLKLVEAMSKVNFNVGVFNDAVGAGFSR